MASTCASPVARSRICRAITLVDAFFRFCRRLVGASAFGKLIDALEESTKVFFVVSLLVSFRLWRISVLPRA